MIGPELSSSEQSMANAILKQMGLGDSDAFKDDIDYELKRDYERHQEMYENSNIVDKPEFARKREITTELRRRGAKVDGKGLVPLVNNLIVKMHEEVEKTTKSGIIIADIRPVKQDNPKCTVVALNNLTEYEVKVGDEILIDLRHVKHRYFYDGRTHLVINKEGILGIYE